MRARLHRGEIAHHLATLRKSSTLTALQAARLSAILDTLADDGRFLLRAALDAAEFPAGDAHGQEAFQEFRKRVNHAAAGAGVDLQLELDSRKAPPERRHGWFTGGDLVDEGIASFTGQAAGRTGIEHPVPPEVAELGLSRRTRVYVSVPPTDNVMARKVRMLLRQLREALALDRERSWEVADSGSVGLGEDPEVARDRLCAQADVRLALVNPAYLADVAAERRRTLDSPGRVVAFALSGLPEGPLDLGPLRLHDVRRRTEPWDELTRTAQRRRYVTDVVDEIRRALRPSWVTAEDRTPDDPLTQWAANRAWRRQTGESAVLIEPELATITLRESQLDRAASAHGPALPAVGRLVDWARDPKPGAPRLCALLGDVGMGKTTTAKLFTQRLLDLRASGAGCPLPILFDLRDVRIPSLVATMTLDHILDSMFDANWPAGVPRDRLSADVVRGRLRQGDAVIVFDGLDEVLVHLDPHDQQLFTRQLWRAIGEGSDAKMLLTCRTQYFRTIREEVTYFTGEGRQGLRGEDYLALLMLPFRERQVREYLAANLDRDAGWVQGFLDTIGAVHDLPGLTRRPLTLRLIADQVEFIETAKLHGRTLRAVDLYGEVVERWLSRDTGRHTLIPEHKQLLMEEIAAGLWRSGRNSWEAAEVDNWLLDVLERRPDLQRHYRERVPDLWKADFRTATFLNREEDTFAFGHRSLAEYFLARHLCRILIDAGSTADWGFDALAMPVPSPETLDFLGQSIAGAAAEHRSAALAGLERIGRRYVPQASELAFAYALRAAEHGYPHQSLVGVRLAGARLSGWAIGAQRHDDTRLPMAGADLTGADLRRATFHQVDLTGADLSGADLTVAELHNSCLTSARFVGARAIGTVVRECVLDGAEIARAATYRTQILRCTPAPAPAPGLLIAPLPGGGRQAADVSPVCPLTGHTDWALAVAWSPDGTRLLTGGDDGTVRVWDQVTAEPLHQLTGHTGAVLAVAWSPDGTRLLTGDYDGTVRVWDAATAAPLHELTGHTGAVLAVAWSPDGTRLLIGGTGGTVRVWDAATAEALYQLTGHTDWVLAVAWSPDGTRLLTCDGGTVRVWDAATAAPLRELTGHTGAVLAVAWSPDGTRLLTGGG
ncbi:MAG: pentapeptide repeat-containing protein, partial [Pseudonocardiaceae bacterium]